MRIVATIPLAQFGLSKSDSNTRSIQGPAATANIKFYNKVKIDFRIIQEIFVDAVS